MPLPLPVSPLTVEDPAAIRDILRETRTIAVVGLSSDPRRPSHGVAAYLQHVGYRILPVNPNEREVLGEPAYPTLADAPLPIDLVDVFRRRDAVPEVARQAVAVGAKTLWLQIGVVSLPAVEIATEGGLRVVMNRCSKIEHARLLG